VSAGEILLTLPFSIDLALTVASHGWAYLAPWTWDSGSGVLARRVLFDAAIKLLPSFAPKPAFVF